MKECSEEPKAKETLTRRGHSHPNWREGKFHTKGEEEDNYPKKKREGERLKNWPVQDVYNKKKNMKRAPWGQFL